MNTKQVIGKLLKNHLQNLKSHYACVFTIVALAFMLMWYPAPVDAQDTSCPGTPQSNLRVGILGQVTFTDGSTTRLRDNPTTGGNILAQMPEGQPFEVIDGPRCADGYLWWQLSLLGQQAIGWAAEGNSEAYFIEPLTVIAGTQERIRNQMISHQSTQPRLIAFLSPDRTRVQTVSTDNLNEPLTLYTSSQNYLSCPQWSLDGRYFAFQSIPNTSDYSVELIVVDARTQAIVRNTMLSAGGRYVVWSPNLDEVAYYEPLSNEFNNEGLLNRGHGITVLNLESSQTRYLPPAAESVFFPGTNTNLNRAMIPIAWSPDGNTIAFAGVIYYEGSQTFGFISVDGSRMTEQVVVQYADGLYFDWDSSPSRIYYSWLGRLYASSLDINDRTWLLGDGLFQVSSPRVSTDGSLIVFERDLKSVRKAGS